jgi:hypothetical protein
LVPTHLRRYSAFPQTGVFGWLRGVDLNHRPLGYEPNELPDCSTPQFDHNNQAECRQTCLLPKSVVDANVFPGSAAISRLAKNPSILTKMGASNRYCSDCA